MAVFQDESDWLNDVAPMNVMVSEVTLDVSHVDSGRLKEVAEVNIPVIEVTLEVSQERSAG